MKAIETINHKGRKTVIMDLSNVVSIEDLSLRVQTIIAEIRKSAKPKSVYALLDLTNLKINKSTLPYIKMLSMNNGKFIKYAVFVGFTPIYSLIFRIMLRITKRTNHIVVKTREEGLNWLGNH